MSDSRPRVSYPLILQPVLKEKVCGADDLYPILGIEGNASAKIGEAWIVYDGNRIENGPLQGRTLADLVREHPRAVLGGELVDRGLTAFPLLAWSTPHERDRLA